MRIKTSEDFMLINRVIVNAGLAILLVGLPNLALARQSADPSSSPRNSQDVPTQKPGTSSPDVNKQTQPAPVQPSGNTQPGDVPQQKPGTDSPDVAKQHHSAPKKSKRARSTTSTT